MPSSVVPPSRRNSYLGPGRPIDLPLYSPALSYPALIELRRTQDDIYNTHIITFPFLSLLERRNWVWPTRPRRYSNTAEKQHAQAEAGNQYLQAISKVDAKV